MRTIERTGAFRKDLRRELRGRHAHELRALLDEASLALANDEPLGWRWRDHGLVGSWLGHRDCHLKPDLVLIYRYVGNDELHLVRLGSHSELGL